MVTDTLTPVGLLVGLTLANILMPYFTMVVNGGRATKHQLPGPLNHSAISSSQCARTNLDLEVELIFEMMPTYN